MMPEETRVGLALYQRRQPMNGQVYEQTDTVSSLVREAFAEGGLGLRNPEVPLADIIEPGMTVLLKPNWVLQYNKSNKGMACMVTHPRFIEAVLKEVQMTKPRRVLIADAPIPSCVFEKLVSPEWTSRLKLIASPYPLEIIDLRKSIYHVTRWAVKVTRGLRDMNSYVLFDLATKSLLEPISLPIGRFRNTSYAPDALTKTHFPGCHQYLLCREAFEADIIINLPKLKTHGKAGMTGALKNIVGISGDKDYLPHHRLGGTVEGGDCYEGSFPLKRLTEYFLDNANRRINRRGYIPWIRGAGLLLRLNNAILGEKEIEGSWYGNDTVWRMTLDLNRLLLYGRSDGSLSATPLRRIYSLTDGIVAGEGMGPLAPEPVECGAVTFASSSAFADLAHTALMKFDWRKIPLIRNSFQDFPYCLTTHRHVDIRIFTRGRSLSLSELAARYGQKFRPSNGWKQHIEMNE